MLTLLNANLSDTKLLHQIIMTMSLNLATKKPGYFFTEIDLNNLHQIVRYSNKSSFSAKVSSASGQESIVTGEIDHNEIENSPMSKEAVLMFENRVCQL